jgi:hypothetical protein
MAGIERNGWPEWSGMSGRDRAEYARYGFPIHKSAIFRKIKENKGFRGDVLKYVAQGTSQFDAEIVEKGHLWMETK